MNKRLIYGKHEWGNPFGDFMETMKRKPMEGEVSKCHKLNFCKLKVTN